MGNPTEQQKEIYEKILANHLASMEKKNGQYGLPVLCGMKMSRSLRCIFQTENGGTMLLMGLGIRQLKLSSKSMSESTVLPALF